VKFFWPNRAKARGFSIENPSLKYREKTVDISSIEIQNQCRIESPLRSKNKVINHLEKYVTSRKKDHWANRDFSEYDQVS
tara:strand:- start:286 stop:525 length:240 start_codon:yes stop_codon:yes gene_type:complete